MRLITLTLALLGALTAASAQASVLTSRNLTQGAELLNTTSNLTIDPQDSLFGLDIQNSLFTSLTGVQLNLDALGSPAGAPLTATDFNLSLFSNSLSDVYFGSGVAADNSTAGRLELLIETDPTTSGFSTFTQFLLVVVIGEPADFLNSSVALSAAESEISIFATSPVAAVPLPASLPLLLGGIAALAALRRRARAA